MSMDSTAACQEKIIFLQLASLYNIYIFAYQIDNVSALICTLELHSSHLGFY